jgi:hypothetical protein
LRFSTDNGALNFLFAVRRGVAGAFVFPESKDDVVEDMEDMDGGRFMGVRPI